MKDNIKKLSYIHMPMKREFGFEFSWKNAHKNRWKKMAPIKYSLRGFHSQPEKTTKNRMASRKKTVKKKVQYKKPAERKEHRIDITHHLLI
jgi:hypothetical protein